MKKNYLQRKNRRKIVYNKKTMQRDKIQRISLKNSFVKLQLKFKIDLWRVFQVMFPAISKNQVLEKNGFKVLSIIPIAYWEKAPQNSKLEYLNILPAH